MTTKGRVTNGHKVPETVSDLCTSFVLRDISLSDRRDADRGVRHERVGVTVSVEGGPPSKKFSEEDLQK